MHRRGFLKTLAAASAYPLWPDPARGAGARQPAYGWDLGVEGPVTADIHVAPWGNDAGRGDHDHPLRSLAAGVARLAALGRGSLALRGGLYREQVSLTALRGTRPGAYRIHRYGAERPVVTAAEPLTGWVPCPDEVARRHGLDPKGIHLARLPKARIRHGDPLALNLHEAGHWCPISTLRADLGNPAAASDAESFFEAEPILAGENLVGFRDPRLSRLSARQMAGARVLVHHAPNMVSPDPIARFDPAAGVIRLADGRRRVQRRGDRALLRYAIQNAAVAPSPGTWIVRDEGDEVLILFRPRDPANLDGAIEASLRDHCIDLGDASHVELFGLEMIRAAGGGASGAIALRRQPGTGAGARGVSIRHCRAGETLFTGERGSGAISLRGIEGLSLDQVTVEDVRGSFGIFLSDCSGATLRGMHLSRITQSPLRFFGVRQAVFAFSLIETSGQDAHANKFNFYEGCDSVLVYGVRTRDCRGYVTFQKASRIAFAFCEFDCDPRSFGRALVAQMHPSGAGMGGADGSGDPVAGSTIWLWNLTLAAAPRRRDPPNALALGPGGNSQRYRLHNCILDGGGYADIYLRGADPAKETRSHNGYTGLAYWQQARYGWRPGKSEFEMTGAAAATAGRDMRDAIADLARRFPDFADWDRDIDGRAVDWSRPPVGCRVKGG